MKLIQNWWNFSKCWNGVGAPLFWWSLGCFLLFILAVVLFLREKTLANNRWSFLLVIVITLFVHFIVILLTWSRVYATLYTTSYMWAPGEQEKNAFLLWQATIGMGTLSSCLLLGTLLLLKRETPAKTSELAARNLVEL